MVSELVKLDILRETTGYSRNRYFALHDSLHCLENSICAMRRGGVVCGGAMRKTHIVRYESTMTRPAYTMSNLENKTHHAKSPSVFNAFTNEYSYTKGMRLKLMHTRGTLPEPDTVEEVDLAKLCEVGRRLAEELEKFIYQPESENPEALARDRHGEYKPSHDVRINKTWLKQFFKVDFYDQRQARRQRTHELHQFPYALQGIADWRTEWRKNINKLEEADKSALHDQTRRSDIASLLLQLGRRDQLPLIREFAAHARHKNKANPLPDYAEAVEEQLQAALAEYAPSQGAGVVVAAASLNYYTVNKKPKEYYDDKIGKVKKQYERLAPDCDRMKANKARQKSRLLELMLGERLNLEQIQDDKELSLFHNAQDRG